MDQLRAGWLINDKRVERIWRREGLKVPRKQPERGRLWLTEGSCIRLRPEHCNHVWSYDFVEDRTHDRRRFRMLNVIDVLSDSFKLPRSPRGHQPRIRPKDASDRGPPVLPHSRSCGRSVAALYNAVRPHAALGYKAPAPEVFVPALAACAAARRSCGSRAATLSRRSFPVGHLEIGRNLNQVITPTYSH